MRGGPRPSRPMGGGTRLAVAALAACQACAPSGVDDHAGDLPLGAPSEIEAEARLCVGVTVGDPAQEFDRVVTPFVLPDGRLAVPLSGPREIRLFDSRGTHLATVGRAGEGPGEFVSLQAAWARGDTIEAFDDRLHRVTRFLPGGGVEVVPLQPVPSAQAALAGAPSFGWVLTGVADAGMGRRDQVAIHRFARDGEHLGEMGRVAGMARYAVPGFSGPDPLSPRTVFALNGDRTLAGETLTPALRVLGPDGTVEREISWTPGASVDPRAAYRTVVDEAVARAGPGRAADVRRRLEAFPATDRVSVFWGAIVDAQGFLWVRPFDPLRHSVELGGYRNVGTGGTWLVFDPQGAPMPSVTMPADVEPVGITAHAVIGIRRDELGVESVCVHSLRRNR